MKKTLPALRVSERTYEKMVRAIEKNNQGSLSKLSVQEFRRIALWLLAQAILTNNRDVLDQIELTD